MVVVNYIMWTVINNFIKAMPQKYRDAYDDFAVTFMGNRTSYQWMECIDKMQTVFGMPLGLLFVDAAFDERSKETVRELNSSGSQMEEYAAQHLFNRYVKSNPKHLPFEWWSHFGIFQFYGRKS